MDSNDDCKSLEKMKVVLKSGAFDVSLRDGGDVPYTTNARMFLGWVLLLLKVMKHEPSVLAAERYSP